MVHADTLFDDGPAKNDAGELRGLGAPAPIDPHSAAEAGPHPDRRRRRHPRPARRRRRCPAAHPAAAEGATGRLDPRTPRRPGPQDLARPTRPADRVLRAHGGDHRPRPRRPPPVHLLRLRPARQSRCDLDHDESWPRGPTSVTNLCPRCRRHHELKTRGLVHTRLHPDGSLTTTTLLGTAVTTRPEPLPGHGPARPTRATPRAHAPLEPQDVSDAHPVTVPPPQRGSERKRAPTWWRPSASRSREKIVSG